MADGKRKPGHLHRIMREVRIANAERNDVVVELHEAEQARLEILAEALEGVCRELPRDAEQYLLGILPGQSPRYWVDATSFVMMGRDKREYQFVKDTRLGRSVLAESTGVHTIADAVTRYVAERLVEREQALEGDWLTRSLRQQRQGDGSGKSGLDQALIWGFSGFGLGMIAGMFLLLAYAWFMAG